VAARYASSGYVAGHGGGVVSLVQSKRRAVLEGWAHMRPDDWGVPHSVWISERPDDDSPGNYLDHVLDDLGVPTHRLLGLSEYRRVKITVELLP